MLMNNDGRGHAWARRPACDWKRTTAGRSGGDAWWYYDDGYVSVEPEGGADAAPDTDSMDVVILLQLDRRRSGILLMTRNSLEYEVIAWDQLGHRQATGWSEPLGVPRASRAGDYIGYHTRHLA